MLKFGAIGLLSTERKTILPWVPGETDGGFEMGRKTPTGMINWVLMTKSHFSNYTRVQGKLISFIR